MCHCCPLWCVSCDFFHSLTCLLNSFLALNSLSDALWAAASMPSWALAVASTLRDSTGASVFRRRPSWRFRKSFDFAWIRWLRDTISVLAPAVFSHLAKRTMSTSLPSRAVGAAFSSGPLRLATTVNDRSEIPAMSFFHRSGWCEQKNHSCMVWFHSSRVRIRLPSLSHARNKSFAPMPQRESISTIKSRSVSPVHKMVSIDMPAGGSSVALRPRLRRLSRLCGRPRMNSNSSSKPIRPL
mmetsp:Transcript_18216/g.46655  ORF Transcript_18216/g.46655 Transcript_18216/m.46655 type:complete len:240 (-) Transcript_18216:206-925(-)